MYVYKYVYMSPSALTGYIYTFKRMNVRSANIKYQSRYLQASISLLSSTSFDVVFYSYVHPKPTEPTKMYMKIANVNKTWGWGGLTSFTRYILTHQSPRAVY